MVLFQHRHCYGTKITIRGNNQRINESMSVKNIKINEACIDIIMVQI